MSRIKTVVFDIEDDIRLGVLSFNKIAEKHDVTVDFVNMVWEQMCEREFSNE